MNNSHKINFLLGNIDASIISTKLKNLQVELLNLNPDMEAIEKIKTFFSDTDISNSKLIKIPTIPHHIIKYQTQKNTVMAVISNCTQAIDFMDTGTNSLQEMNELLEYSQTICIAAANETKNATDRTQMAEEYLSLINECQLIAKNTEFNSVYIFNDGNDKNSFIGEFEFKIREGTGDSASISWQPNVAWRLGLSNDTSTEPFGNVDTAATERDNSRYQTLYRYLEQPQFVEDQRKSSPRFGNDGSTTSNRNNLNDTQNANPTANNWNTGSGSTDLGSQCLSTITHSNAELAKVIIVKQTTTKIYNSGLSVVDRINSSLTILEKKETLLEKNIQDVVSNSIKELEEDLIDAIQYYEIKEKIYNKFVDF